MLRLNPLFPNLAFPPMPFPTFRNVHWGAHGAPESSGRGPWGDVGSPSGSSEYGRRASPSRAGPLLQILPHKMPRILPVFWQVIGTGDLCSIYSAGSSLSGARHDPLGRLGPCAVRGKR